MHDVRCSFSVQWRASAEKLGQGAELSRGGCGGRWRRQAVMSFHACGPNVGDEVDVPLPSWVLEAAKHNPSLLYRDKHGYHNPECLSLWADEEPALAGRTPLQCYTDFMASFRVRSSRASPASPPLVHCTTPQRRLWREAPSWRLEGDSFEVGRWTSDRLLWRRIVFLAPGCFFEGSNTLTRKRRRRRRRWDPQDAMAPDLGEGRTITDVCIGCGPCGELRYPSYPENRRALRSSQWLFPGVGEFQCYDHHALTSLRQTAELGGVPQWGTSGPHDAGGYNDWPESTGFFRSEGGSWDRCAQKATAP